jgi:hypothetical protein
MTEEPKLIIPEGTPEFTLKINQPNWYDVDADKLTSAKDIAKLLTALDMKVCENYENFDEVKKFLIIPEKPKTLEEISQELDEKFEKHIESVKDKFALSKESAEYHYNRKFETINGNFEYAKSYGYFPQITFLDSSKFTISSKFDISSPTFMVKNGNNHQGYYTIGDGYYRFYMEKKPNRVFRWFVKQLMGFKWIDEVLK